jgi:hypothetical protein
MVVKEEDRERIKNQLNFDSRKIYRVWQGSAGDGAYLRFILNRNFVTRKWSAGSHEL